VLFCKMIHAALFNLAAPSFLLLFFHVLFGKWLNAHLLLLSSVVDDVRVQ
jgi:hypothetical protein